MNKLKDKYGDWALITGASSGIGKEFANQLAAFGFNLILVARRKERLEELKKELEAKHKIEVAAAAIDLLSENYLNELNQQVGNKNVGLLINNAGFGIRGEFINSKPEVDTQMIKLNCIVPTELTHFFLPQMIEKKKGGIIFLASVVSFQPTPTMAVYSATKVFNAFLSESLSYELTKHKIDVLSLNPGGTSTEFQSIANSTTGPAPRTVEQVVTTALNTIGKKPLVVDGLYNKVLTFSTRFVSRRFAVNSAGKISELLYMKN